MIEASVVVCAYTLDRWEQLRNAVESVRAQTQPPREILLVIDGNEELRRRASREIAGATVVANAKAKGLSGGRMTGAELATAPIIAFLDDDAIADRCWLAELLAAYKDPLVLGAGGYIEPLWSTAPPNWFPPEFYWVVGCTYAGMPVRNGRVRNLIGANMSVRAEVLLRTGGFASKLGRREGDTLVGGVAESCEETEFCIRAARLHPGGFWAYRPTARVQHCVPRERMTRGYFVRRCRMEGAAKAVMAGLTGARDGLGSERRYVLTLARAVLRDLLAAARGDLPAVGRATAICTGLGITAFAYLRTRLACMQRPEPGGRLPVPSSSAGG